MENGLAAEAAEAATAGEALAHYLHGQATVFLRALGMRSEHEAEADDLLRSSARRISGALLVYAPLADAAWADPLRAELAWLSATLSREPQYTGRLHRLLEALHRLSTTGDPAAPDPVTTADPAQAAPDTETQSAPRSGANTPAAAGQSSRSGATPSEPLSAATAQSSPQTAPAALPSPPPGSGPLALGAARAGALLDRQLTLARTRAHSATLQAMGSSRFHALADAIAVLASEVPLSPAAAGPAATVLPPLAAQASQRLADAAAALPLLRAAHPYNAEAVQAALGAELTADLQDAPWHQVRVLLRLARYAAEVVPPGQADSDEGPRYAEAARLLARHREAAESAAAVATAARTPRIAPATAYALGVLHADQRHEVEAARFAFSRLWQPAALPGARRE
ncbi:CHAD domain-containing protein [Streptomyces sp. NPDC051976]|uniref:CHAD domain-containing protein n=1 Tax=Streptomyces sp. NPDC051976 TaxID=3154947 RepID=UPI00342BC72B